VPFVVEESPLSGADRTEVSKLCERFEFPLERIEEDGDVLVLVPDSVERIPASGRLGELALELRERGYRHVAFAIQDDE
jgi:hypothetical protein